jgi:cytochrome c oxidase subunit 2
MSGLIIVLLVVLVFIIIYQIGKSSEYASVISGEAQTGKGTNRTIAALLVLFFILGLIGIWQCNEYFKGKLLPIAASKTGVSYDTMFTVTLIVTGIVFFATQAVLFWFAYKYQSSEKRKTSYFFSHDNRLEVIWTTIPAIAMTVLVVIGLKNWFEDTAPAPDNAMVVEIVGKQFNWIVRYPGKDNELGVRDFRKIDDANNILGLDWKDPHNLDDVITQGELHLVVNKPVKLLIGSRDVIHDVGLPHFRMKMDAVPGIATTLSFTPTITTDSMKVITGNPDFVYEIACDQLCGKGHYAMRGTIIVETQQQYDAWLAKQQSYYATNNPAAAQPAATAATPADGGAPAKTEAAAPGKSVVMKN